MVGRGAFKARPTRFTPPLRMPAVANILGGLFIAGGVAVRSSETHHGNRTVIAMKIELRQLAGLPEIPGVGGGATGPSDPIFIHIRGQLAIRNSRETPTLDLIGRGNPVVREPSMPPLTPA